MIICCVFGIVIGLLGSISTIIGPIDKIYKTIMNIAFWLVVFVTIAVTSMLRVDWYISKSQLLTGVIAEIGFQISRSRDDL